MQTYLKSHRGQILIDLSKDLIRSGRMDYANITLLHSLDIDAPGARFQRAKWIWKQGQAQQAIAFLRATIDAEKDLTESSSQIQLNQPPLRGKVFDKNKCYAWDSY